MFSCLWLVLRRSSCYNCGDENFSCVFDSVSPKSPSKRAGILSFVPFSRQAIFIELLIHGGTVANNNLSIICWARAAKCAKHLHLVLKGNLLVTWH